MAKDKVKVPSIKISNQRPGVAFGGVIYSSDVTVGYNAEPTKLNINVALDTKISKKRDFLISKRDLDLTSPVDIKIADEPMFKNMFLHSYSTNTSVGSKTLNLTYVDGSALLDRIFVGLIHEHFQIDQEKHMVANVVVFDAKCPKIELATVGDTTVRVCAATGSVLYKDLKVFKHLASPTGIPGRPYQIYMQNENIIWEGGYIVLGREEFSEVTCDIRDVSYGFEDLLASLEHKKYGWGINIDKSRYTVTEDSNLLLRSYTGTVKDVLQNWGNDLKISYYWDFTKKYPTLAIISNADRSVDVKVELTAAAIEKLDVGRYSDGSSGSAGDATDFIINSKSESFTLDGTLSQAYSSTFTVGPSAKTVNKRKTSEIFFSCQTIDDIAASGNISGRSSRDVKISLGLGKFSKDLRDIWNVRKAIAITMQKGLVSALPYFRAIGFHEVLPVTFGAKTDEDFREYVIGMCNLTQMFTNQAGKQNSDDFLKDLNNPGGYELFVGLYDDSLKSLHSSVEGEIESGFIGKHYVFGAPKAEYFEGNSYYKHVMKSETKPSSTYYSLNQHYKTPLAKFVQKIQDLRLNRLAQSEDAYINTLYDKTNKLKTDVLEECRKKNRDKSLYKDSMTRGFYHFERQAHWATYQEDIENLLNPNQLQLQSWLDNDGKILYHDDKERIRDNMLKEYVPFNSEMPMILQFIEKMPSVMKTMIAAGEASDKKVVVCMVKTGNQDLRPFGTGNSPPMNGEPGKGGSTVIGDKVSGYIRLEPDFKEPSHDNNGRYVGISGGCRNPIEEMNALRSLCDRTSSARVDEISKYKTKCERDFMEELCSSVSFGQEDKTCGEAEAVKDSLYSLELEPDVRSATSSAHGIYSDCIHLYRFNPSVDISVTGKKLKLYSDTRLPTIVTDRNKVDIIYPSENLHNGMLIYNSETTTTDLGVRKVIDPINGSRVRINKAASSVHYQTKDITQDVTTVVNDENQAKILKGDIPTNIVADLDNIQEKDGDQTYTLLQTQTAEEYHERLKGNINNIQIEEPRKSYTYKVFVDGSEGVGAAALKDLIKLLKPENGLESLSINMDEGGFNISINLSNRASADVALKEIYNKVGPVAKEYQGRKFSTLRSI